MVKGMLGIGAVQLGPGPTGDGIGDPFPVSGIVIMDVGREDIGDLVLLEQRQQFGGQLRAQAVMILTTPGIKEGYVKKNQPGPGGLGFLQLRLQPAKLFLAQALRGGIIDHDEVVIIKLEGIIIRPENLVVEHQALVAVELMIADHR